MTAEVVDFQAVDNPIGKRRREREREREREKEREREYSQISGREKL